MLKFHNILESILIIRSYSTNNKYISHFKIQQNSCAKKIEWKSLHVLQTQDMKNTCHGIRRTKIRGNTPWQTQKAADVRQNKNKT